MEKRIVVGFTLVFLVLLLGSLLPACNQAQDETTAPESGAPETGDHESRAGNNSRKQVRPK